MVGGRENHAVPGADHTNPAARGPVDRGTSLIMMARGVYGGAEVTPNREGFQRLRKGVLMRRLTRCIAAICLLTLLSGCVAFTRAPRSTVLWNYPHATERSLTQSPHEHYQTASNIAAHDAQALIEDLDLLFMTDRPTRLTRWQAR